MSDFYIYSTKYTKTGAHRELETKSITIIFCNGDFINEKNIQNEVKLFYEKEYQTDEILVIGGEFIFERIQEVFVNGCLETFKFIPKLQSDHLSENIYIYTYNKEGALTCRNRDNGIDETTIKQIINDGLISIFISRGGLIEAKGDAHHFIFPSGKHSNKFLRTGNILINSPEIYFIAFNLLSLFDEDAHEKIYCDTSSINTLAFALLDLKRRLTNEPNFGLVPVESFSSYEGLFSKKVRFFDNSLILISSSTSGNIIERITDHDESVNTKNIAILFFLGSNRDYKTHENNIVCNLTKNANAPKGIMYYDTYTAKECVHCKQGSFPVEVKGDVFLLEKPKINRVTLKTTDAPKKLSSFIKQFKSRNIEEKNVFKVNYKENRDTERKYEVYFDMMQVLTSIEENTTTDYSDFRSKLFNYINQYIPSNTKYLIALPDSGSEKLCKIITDYISQNYVAERLPQTVKFNEFSTVITDENIDGAAVIVGSIISNGKNLLYLSRALRTFNKLRLVYFIGLVQMNNNKDLEFLKQNLKQGNYGKETNSFYDVESFFCDNDSKNTTWVFERKFLLELVELSDSLVLTEASQSIRERVELIDSSWSNTVKGLANQLFYPNPNGEELRLRKGFAFIDFDRYIDNISQADVYYSMSAILNELRNCDDYEHCLKQFEYMRNLLDPGNFNRFNDGIIQACILRASKQSELLYHLDATLSNDMKVILEKIIEESSSPQGEGLIEFLYAIAIRKLTIRREHLLQLSEKITPINNEMVKLFHEYIKANILIEKPSMLEKMEAAELKIEELEQKIFALENPQIIGDS